MERHEIDRLDRRRLLLVTLAAPALGLAPGSAGAQQPLLPVTPACADGDDATPPQTEGPFYTPRSPRRHDLRADGPDDPPVSLIGFVLSRRCRPIADAVVDLWHADGSGRYDNAGFRFRGHQVTDAGGRYLFETIRPGRYVTRTPHYHVKVQVPGQPLLTTQLYFPGEARNRADFLFDPALLMDARPDAEGLIARFDFVLDTG